MRRLFALLAVATLPTSARAGGVRGQVVLPKAAPTSTAPLAFWRIAGGRLPIQPPRPRDDAAVVLVPEPPPGATEEVVRIELPPHRFGPKLVVVPLGATVEFRNLDQAPRTLYLENGENFMPREATPPGAARRLPFSVAGEYRVRDAGLPRAVTTLVVVPARHQARLDERGSFRLEAPAGPYTLRLFFDGRWAATRRIELPRVGEVRVQIALDER